MHKKALVCVNDVTQDRAVAWNDYFPVGFTNRMQYTPMTQLQRSDVCKLTPIRIIRSSVKKDFSMFDKIFMCVFGWT